MRFIWREALWLLLAVPLLVGAYEAIVRRAASIETVRSTRLELVRATVGSSQWMRRRIPPLLVLVGIAGLLLACARPAAVFLLPAQRGTVVLAMDVSISMAATDVTPTRLAAAQAAAAKFVQDLPEGIRVGVIAFGGYADPVLMPTTDKARVSAALRRLTLERYTALGTGLLAALLMIHPAAAVDPKYDLYLRMEPEPPRPLLRHSPSRPRAPKRSDDARPVDPSALIILVSDGHGTMGVPALKAAELAAAYGVRVYTIGVGTPYGGPAQIEGHEPVHADFEEETLKLVAEFTGAEYFHASSLERIASVYEVLSREAVRERKELELSAVVAAAGGVALVLGAVLSLAWHDRLLA